MRISAIAFAVVLGISLAAEGPKSQFITSSDGLKIHYLELGSRGTPVMLIHARTHRIKREVTGARIVVLPKETHGSVHLNQAYTSTLVQFIDAHDK